MGKYFLVFGGDDGFNGGIEYFDIEFVKFVFEFDIDI